MSVLIRALLQHVTYRRAYTKSAASVKAHAYGYLIGGDKTNAVDVVHHLIWIFFYYPLGAVAILLIDFKRQI